ncbi:MAG: GNAT family N-acetyltransferase [Candidatus Symbiothrix sp.]|jgi:predicted acetyltransferase|nr:GNAT family N-acetyltransferase [Candidatus Symbiothrix sp.]
MIQEGEEKYKAALKEMWKQCFPTDTDAFVDFYFDAVYQNDETLVYVEDNQPVAALQMIPYTIKTGHTLHPAGYISGVMTHPGYRKRGYMEKLLNAAFEAMQQKGYDYTFLIPQEEWLVGFYGKYGFQVFVSPSLKNLKRLKRLKDLKKLKAYDEHARFLLTIPNAVLKSERQFANMVVDFLAEGGEFIDSKEKQGMIKKINPLVETVTSLYLGRMLD